MLSNLFTESGSYLYGNLNDFIVDYVNWKTPIPTATCATTARLAGRCYTGNYQQGFGPLGAKFSTNDYNFYRAIRLEVPATCDLQPGRALRISTVAGRRNSRMPTPAIIPNISRDRQ